VKIEDITAPPPRLSPEMRYASLHRTVESGLATDRTWAELIEVCLELGLKDEAQSSFEELQDPSARRRMLVLLQRNKLLLHVSLSPAETGGGPAETERRPATARETLVDQLLDGFRFLFSDHMPLTAIVATVTFPIVVGLGGFLTSTVQSSFILPLLALIPALSVVGLVGALGRRILVDASRGLDDPPEIPSAADLIRESARFLVDATVLCAIFLGPGAVLTQLVEHTGFGGVAAAFAVGLLLLPMAMAMRQTRDDWSCLRPMTLFRAIVRGGLDYMAVVGVSVALFAPSLLSVWATGGSHLYLVVSVVGPLAVVPTFVVSRLLGQFLFAKRKALTAADATTRTAGQVPAPRKAPAARPQAARPALRSPSHPEARRTPAKAAPAPRTAPAARPAASPRPAGPLGTWAPQQNRPAPAGGARPAPATPAGLPAPRLRARTETVGPPTPARGSRRTIGEEIPDLTRMPGVAVLRGEDRVNAGAAAPIRPR
jgi:hypothetical protein